MRRGSPSSGGMGADPGRGAPGRLRDRGFKVKEAAGWHVREDHTPSGGHGGGSSRGTAVTKAWLLGSQERAGEGRNVSCPSQHSFKARPIINDFLLRCF